MHRVAGVVAVLGYLGCLCLLQGCTGETEEERLRRQVAGLEAQLAGAQAERGRLSADVGRLQSDLDAVVARASRDVQSAEARLRRAAEAERERAAAFQQLSKAHAELQDKVKSYGNFAEHKGAVEIQVAELQEQVRVLKQQVAVDSLRLTELDRLRDRYVVLQQSRPASYLEELSRLQMRAGAEDAVVLGAVRLTYEATKAPVLEQVRGSLRLTLPSHLYLPLGEVSFTFDDTVVVAERATFDLAARTFVFEFPSPVKVTQAMALAAAHTVVITVGPSEYQNRLVFGIGDQTETMISTRRDFVLRRVHLAGMPKEMRPPRIPDMTP